VTTLGLSRSHTRRDARARSRQPRPRSVPPTPSCRARSARFHRPASLSRAS